MIPFARLRHNNRNFAHMVSNGKEKRKVTLIYCNIVLSVGFIRELHTLYCGEYGHATLRTMPVFTAIEAGSFPVYPAFTSVSGRSSGHAHCSWAARSSFSSVQYL